MQTQEMRNRERERDRDREKEREREIVTMYCQGLDIVCCKLKGGRVETSVVCKCMHPGPRRSLPATC